MNTTVWAMLGGATGAALVHFGLQRRLMQLREIKIVIKPTTDGRCRSHTPDAKAAMLDVIAWRVVGDVDCLGEARVELRFSGETSPLTERRPRGKRTILGLVVNGKPNDYKYEVWYVGPDGEYMMEDPKLEIVEI